MWGRCNERTEIPIQNVAMRQTYYGALNLFTQEFTIMQADSGNGVNSVLFIKHLQALHPDKQLLILWDGASYHRCQEVKNYLNEINCGLEEKDWKVTCILFAPHAPAQNPTEDVWLKGKNFLRSNFFNNKTFHQVKNCFFNFLNKNCLLYTSPSPRDRTRSRMPSSA